MKRVAAIGPMPPPVHGMAMVHAGMVAALAEVTAVGVIAVTPGRGNRGFRYHLGKIARVAAALPRLAAARLRGARTLYCAVDAGLGGYYCCLYVAMARLLGLEIFLHHHNYNYLVVSTRPMRWLTKTGGRKACHVVLCDRMARDIAAIYPDVGRAMVVPNGIALPPPPMPREDTDVLRLGLLSNLTPEKGVDEFIAIVGRLRADGVAVTGTLAGPVTPPALARRVVERAADPDSGIMWLGPIDGADKAGFFAAIDVFVFPTHMESFGLVLLEALAHGVPVIAPGHGCICVFDDSPAATVVPVDADFVAAASARLEVMARQRDPTLSAAARRQAERLVDRAQTGRAALVATILGKAA